MGKKVDLVGYKFNNLTVIGYLGKDKNKKSLWICKCDCCNQNFLVVRSNDLKTGKRKSCGCSRKTQNGLSHSRLYTTWINMKRRCYNLKDKAYQRYGGRGISVCSEWIHPDNGFLIFYNWAMSTGYNDDLTIDRINNDGNYEPSNCRWITIEEQQSNKSTNKYINYNGIDYTISKLAKILNISYYNFRVDINNGLLVDEIIAKHQKVGDIAC